MEEASVARNILLVRNLSFVLLVMALIGAHGARLRAAPRAVLNGCGYFDDGLGGGVGCTCPGGGCNKIDGGYLNSGDSCYQAGCFSCDENFCDAWMSACVGFCTYSWNVDYSFSGCDNGSCSGSCQCINYG